MGVSIRKQEPLRGILEVENHRKNLCLEYETFFMTVYLISYLPTFQKLLDITWNNYFKDSVG